MPFEMTNFQAVLFDAIYRKLHPRICALLYSQYGKLISHDTPVLTTSGWKKHGELVVGDSVFGLDGKPTKVVALSADDFAEYEVEITNGEKIKCHGRHEWLVMPTGLKDYRTMETQELFNSKLKGNGHYRYRLPNIPVLEFEEKDVPLDPYTLGAWLGNGIAKKPAISINPSPKRIKRISIKNIKKIEPVPGRCIQVENKDGIYLVGKRLVPTHNSDIVSMAILTRITTFPERWVIIGGSEDKAKIVMNKLIGHIFDNEYTKSKLTMKKIASMERLRHERSRTRITFKVGDGIGEVYLLSADTTKTGQDAGDILVGYGAENIVCVPKGFKVATDKGDIEISELVKQKKAKKVYTYNHETNEKELLDILEYQENDLGERDLIEIDLGDRKFQCTEDHPVWVEGKGYIRADEVAVGEVCLREDGNVIVKNIKRIKATDQKVYNLTTAKNHNYFVEGVLVHNCDDAPLMSDTINAKMVRMLGGFQDNFLLKIGNAINRNHFYRSFNSDRYVKIMANYEVGIIEGRQTKEYFDEMKEEMFNQVLFDSFYTCKFPPQDAPVGGTWIPLFTENEIRAAMDWKEAEHIGEKKLGVDVADSGVDHDVIVQRSATYAELLYDNQESDQMTLTGLTVRFFKDNKIDRVYIDKTGVGAGVCSRMRELSMPHRGVNFGEKSLDPMFANKKAEMYWSLRKWLNDGGKLSKDERWLQLTNIMYGVIESSGKVQIMPKRVALGLGIKSPDYADALAITFYDRDRFKATPEEKFEKEFEKMIKAKKKKETSGYHFKMC